jgi:hypothetical protein
VQFSDLTWTEFPDNPEWVWSGPLAYTASKAERRVAVFKSVVGHQEGYDVEALRINTPVRTLHDNIDLVELCAGVLPFCDPLPYEVTTDE